MSSRITLAVNDDTQQLTHEVHLLEGILTLSCLVDFITLKEVVSQVFLGQHLPKNPKYLFILNPFTQNNTSPNLNILMSELKYIQNDSPLLPLQGDTIRVVFFGEFPTLPLISTDLCEPIPLSFRPTGYMGPAADKAWARAFWKLQIPGSPVRSLTGQLWRSMENSGACGNICF